LTLAQTPPAALAVQQRDTPGATFPFNVSFGGFFQVGMAGKYHSISRLLGGQPLKKAAATMTPARITSGGSAQKAKRENHNVRHPLISAQRCHWRALAYAPGFGGEPRSS
jgi:hypothetical protein